jgi:hypothetical protein
VFVPYLTFHHKFYNYISNKNVGLINFTREFPIGSLKNVVPMPIQFCGNLTEYNPLAMADERLPAINGKS